MLINDVHEANQHRETLTDPDHGNTVDSGNACNPLQTPPSTCLQVAHLATPQQIRCQASHHLMQMACQMALAAAWLPTPARTPSQQTLQTPRNPCRHYRHRRYVTMPAMDMVCATSVATIAKVIWTSRETLAKCLVLVVLHRRPQPVMPCQSCIGSPIRRHCVSHALARPDLTCEIITVVCLNRMKSACHSRLH